MQGKPANIQIKRHRSPGRIEQLEVERIVELCLEHLFVTKVLDVGCATGLFAEAFALRNLNVVGIDKNPLKVKNAADKISNARFQEGSAEMLPFSDKSFDLVFICHILHKSDDPLLVLKEAGRVARVRVAVLEWANIEVSTTQPLPRSLDPQKIKKLTRSAGMTAVKKHDLENMVLYRMKPDGNT